MFNSFNQDKSDITNATNSRHRTTWPRGVSLCESNHPHGVKSARDETNQEAIFAKWMILPINNSQDEYDNVGNHVSREGNIRIIESNFG